MCFYLLALVWQRTQTDWFLLVCAICFSLSSASPAHTPKDEYAVIQPAFAPKLEPVHDQPEEQGERRDDIPELTERKSLSGWSAAHRLLPSLKGCAESCAKALPLIFYHVPRNSSFQWRCLSAACVPLLGLRRRRRKRHGRSIRSSWRRRCKKPGGWCFTCRSALQPWGAALAWGLQTSPSNTWIQIIHL